MSDRGKEHVGPPLLGGAQCGDGERVDRLGTIHGRAQSSGPIQRGQIESDALPHGEGLRKCRRHRQHEASLRVEAIL